MPRILVIGTLSLDVLHLPPVGDDKKVDSVSPPVHTIGGAGLYTALAARAAGAEVTLLAPRAPAPPGCEALWRAVHDRIDWIGPAVQPEALPRLEIVHHGNDQATLLAAQWGGEALLTPTQLPANLEQFDIVHVAALSSAHKQSQFVEACREQAKRGKDGEWAGRLSVGTYARLVQNETETVRSLAQAADYFFLNENEANGLLDFQGDPSRLRTEPPHLLFVTLGERGAWVVRGDARTHVRTQTVQPIDPTGAGDTFCGAVLAALAAGRTPAAAAAAACKLAAREIALAGPAALLGVAERT